MKYGNLVLEKKDFVMIKRFQCLNQYIEDYSHKDALDVLEENMADAFVQNLVDMPDDVVRLYSLVTVTSKSTWSETFQLVVPPEEDIKTGKISVQATLGASVIGRSEGDIVHYGTPTGVMPLKITKVAQTEKNIDTRTPKDILHRKQVTHKTV